MTAYCECELTNGQTDFHSFKFVLVKAVVDERASSVGLAHSIRSRNGNRLIDPVTPSYTSLLLGSEREVRMCVRCVCVR